MGYNSLATFRDFRHLSKILKPRGIFWPHPPLRRECCGRSDCLSAAHTLAVTPGPVPEVPCSVEAKSASDTFQDLK